MYLLAPIIVQKLQKIVRVDPKLLGRFIFGPANSHLAQIRLFQKNHYYNFHAPLGPFP